MAITTSRKLGLMVRPTQFTAGEARDISLTSLPTEDPFAAVRGPQVLIRRSSEIERLSSAVGDTAASPHLANLTFPHPGRTMRLLQREGLAEDVRGIRTDC